MFWTIKGDIIRIISGRKRRVALLAVGISCDQFLRGFYNTKTGEWSMLDAKVGII